MNKNDFEVLNEIYKGSKMATDSITYIEDKIKDSEFSKQVKKEYEDYNNINYTIKDIMRKNNQEVKDVPTTNKVMGWTSIKMNTMLDDTTSHIAEMLIQGTVMGIIEGVRILNKNKNLDNETTQIAEQFVKISEDNIQNLKKFL